MRADTQSKQLKNLQTLPATPRYIMEKRRDALLKEKRSVLHAAAMVITQEVEQHFLSTQEPHLAFIKSYADWAAQERAAALLHSVGWDAKVDILEGTLVVRFPMLP